MADALGREPNAKPEPLTLKQEQDVRTSVEGDPGGRNGYVPNAVILRLLATLDAARAELEALRRILPPMERGQGIVGEGSWSVFAGKMQAERDEARVERDEVTARSVTMVESFDKVTDELAALRALADAVAEHLSPTDEAWPPILEALAVVRAKQTKPVTVAISVLFGLRGECRAVSPPLVREKCAACGHSKALHPTDGGCWSVDGAENCKCVSFIP